MFLCLQIVIKYLFVHINELESLSLAIVIGLTLFDLKNKEFRYKLRRYALHISRVLNYIFENVEALAKFHAKVRLIIWMAESKDCWTNLILGHFKHIINWKAFFLAPKSIKGFQFVNSFLPQVFSITLRFDVLVLIENLSIEVMMTLNFFIKFCIIELFFCVIMSIMISQSFRFKLQHFLQDFWCNIVGKK